MKSVIITRRELQIVVERDGLKDGPQLVVTVRAAAEHTQPPIDLGKRGERKGVHKHFGAAGLSCLEAPAAPLVIRVAGALSA